MLHARLCSRFLLAIAAGREAIIGLVLVISALSCVHNARQNGPQNQKKNKKKTLIHSFCSSRSVCQLRFRTVDEHEEQVYRPKFYQNLTLMFHKVDLN